MPAMNNTHCRRNARRKSYPAIINGASFVVMMQASLPWMKAWL
jgi:hypothetical protein